MTKKINNLEEEVRNLKRKLEEVNNSQEEEVRNLKRQLEKCTCKFSNNLKAQLEKNTKCLQEKPPTQIQEYTLSASKAEHGGKVYITGGTSSDYVQVFDIATKTFSVLPNRMTQMKSHHTSCLIGETIYNFGGFIDAYQNAYSDSVEAMDISEGVWRLKNKLPSTRSYLSSCVIGERAFLFGGYLPEKTTTDEILVYNATTDSYSNGGNVQKRSQHISEEVGGRILIAGGSGYNHNYLSSCKIFDPHTLKCVEAAPLDYKVSAHASSKLTENTVVISGGLFGLSYKPYGDSKTSCRAREVT
eukprot:TRINITY_DN988_c0_g1_i3.p1 TRINITY_DN988_c0_g1~~TRINITY_DN988_c0_g1_i3.p1  ORF type:complete len:301 (-),score=41.66 TRINITY_DN988_c0_g1_i3:275-1177(-)